jgi:serine/threonine-protein kinase
VIARTCSNCGAFVEEGEAHCDTCGLATPSSIGLDFDPDLGQRFGRYRLEELLGAGAMSRVYRARMVDGGHEVAVKVLSAEDSSDPVLSGRFQQEARAMGRLRHENNLTVLDFGRTDDGRLYFVTEVLHGRTLESIVANEAPLEPRRIVRLLSQALDALGEAHHLGIVHRDFKPDNIFVETGADGEERVRVIDYGIAKVHTEIHEPRLTATGSVCGTPDYMAPEQIRGETTDGRVDLYAAGVVLYELLTGTRPFAGSLLQVLTLHMHHPPEPPALRRLDRVVPTALERVCLRALVKRRELRYPTAAAMRADLIAAIPASAPVEEGLPRIDAELPLVGRDAALAALVDLRRGTTLVLGPPGSGRSRLLDEWRRRLLRRRERVLVMQSDPTTAKLPWAPVRRALSQALGIGARPTDEELDHALRDRPADRVGLREVFGLAGAAAPEEREFRRREAMAAAVGVLRDLGGALACEDVDRYDRPSVDVVSALLRDAGMGSVIASATSRGDLPEVAILDLGLIEPRAFEDAGVDVASMGLDPTVQQLPLDVDTAQRAMLELAADPSPRARLWALLPPARRTLAALVVAGLEADVGPLLHVTSLAEVEGPLQTLVQRGLVRLDGERASLPSPTLRDALYAAIDEGERAALHRTWAGLIESEGGDAALVAHHLWAADPDSVPLEFLERAMQDAIRAFDDAGAVRWGARALRGARLPSAVERETRAGVGPQSRLVPRVRIALGLGDALVSVGELPHAERSFREALSASMADPLAVALARRGLSRVASARGDVAAAEQEILAGAAVVAAPSSPDEAAAVAELYLDLAAVRDAGGRRRDAETALIQATVRVGATNAVACRLLLALAERSHSDGRAPDALKLARQALAGAEQVGPYARARAHALLCALDDERGDGASAASHREAAIEGLRQAGDRLTLAELLLRSALAVGPSSELARRWLAEAGDLARQVGWAEGVARAHDGLREFR